MNLTRAAATLTHHLTHRTRLHNILDDQTNNGIRAADYTPSTKPTPQDPPPRPDPTGETAINNDRARQLRTELDQAEAHIIAAVRTIDPHHRTHDWRTATLAAIALTRQTRRNTTPTHHRARHTIDQAAQAIWRITTETLHHQPPQPADLAHLAHDGEPGCQSCARHHGWWNDPDYPHPPTTLDGRLPQPWLLCRACYRFTIENDRPPTTKELAHRKDDPRGHWPRRYDKAA